VRLLKIFNYNEFTAESPAIKISNTGYEANAVHKSADVYLWMGDGGKRDFSRFTGAPMPSCMMSVHKKLSIREN
jgi:hypothetical protein